MKKILSIYFALSTALLMVSCGKDVIEEEQGYRVEYEAVKFELSVSETSLSFSGSEQSQTLHIFCNSYWTINRSPSWLSLSSTSGKGDGSVTVRVSANPSITDSRTGSFDITDGIKTYTVDVTQEPSPGVLSLDNNSLQFSYNGGTSTVYVESNVKWTATSDASWCTVSSSSSYFRVSVDINNSLSQRSATITVSGGSLSQTVTVTQSAVGVPEVGDVYVSNITKTSASCQFSFSSSDLYVQEAGVCYSTSSQEPTTSNDTRFESRNSKSGTVYFSLSALALNTTYYIRAYVKTTAGTTYGKASRFTTEKSNSQL